MIHHREENMSEKDTFIFECKFFGVLTILITIASIVIVVGYNMGAW